MLTDFMMTSIRNRMGLTPFEEKQHDKHYCQDDISFIEFCPECNEYVSHELINIHHNDYTLKMCKHCAEYYLHDYR